MKRVTKSSKSSSSVRLKAALPKKAKKPARKRVVARPKSKAQAQTQAQAEAQARENVQSWLTLAQLRFEKCELAEAKAAYALAYEEAGRGGDLRGLMEALSGLLRLSSEALDAAEMERWGKELDLAMERAPALVPPMAWYCKAVVARYQQQPRPAQKYFHRYLRMLGLEEKANSADALELLKTEEAVAKGWVSLATVLWQRGRLQRALWLANELLRRYEARNLKGINGLLYLLHGNIAERGRDYEQALRWYQKAHGSFLAEHNWYFHLYVLYGYARLNRLQQNYSQAYWYLDLIDRAAAGSEFGFLRREIALERTRLEQDAVDLLVDSRRGIIKTRESGQLSLRKQWVLLHILEALAQAHAKFGDDAERGLSKADIIEQVWKEKYRPEAHDNKLYYNINRLRKLIEPDIRKPQYLLNWKEGYRLAPGLRVQYIGSTAISTGGVPGLRLEASAVRKPEVLLSAGDLKRGDGKWTEQQLTEEDEKSQSSA